MYIAPALSCVIFSFLLFCRESNTLFAHWGKDYTFGSSPNASILLLSYFLVVLPFCRGVLPPQSLPPIRPAQKHEMGVKWTQTIRLESEKNNKIWGGKLRCCGSSDVAVLHTNRPSIDILHTRNAVCIYVVRIVWHNSTCGMCKNIFYYRIQEGYVMDSYETYGYASLAHTRVITANEILLRVYVWCVSLLCFVYE